MHRNFFYCRWSWLSHGAAKLMRSELGNLNHIYGKELNKPDVHQMKGRFSRLENWVTFRDSPYQPSIDQQRSFRLGGAPPGPRPRNTIEPMQDRMARDVHGKQTAQVADRHQCVNQSDKGTREN